MTDISSPDQLAPLRQWVVGLDPDRLQRIRPDDFAKQAIADVLLEPVVVIDEALHYVRTSAAQINEDARQSALNAGVPESRMPLDSSQTLDDPLWLERYVHQLRGYEIGRAITLMHDGPRRIVDPYETMPLYLRESAAIMAMLGLPGTRPKGAPPATYVTTQKVANWLARFPTLDPRSLARIIRKDRQNLAQVPVSIAALIHGDKGWAGRLGKFGDHPS